MSTAQAVDVTEVGQGSPISVRVTAGGTAVDAAAATLLQHDEESRDGRTT